MQGIGQGLNQGIGQGMAAPAGASQSAGAARTQNADGSKPAFADVWNDIQARMGAKAEKPREIKKSLDKDDFMRIMITQMQHQDPTKPFDADKLAAEIAQITSVEQLKNVNTALDKLSKDNKPMERLAMVNLIGKTVTVDRSRFPHQKGSNSPLSFQVPEDAKRVKVTVISQAGEPVFEKDMGSLKAGSHSLTWDGVKSNTIPAESGTYMLRIEAWNDKDVPMQTHASAKARVIGVSYDGTEPVFLVGDANNYSKVTMNSISQIETDAPPPAVSAAGAATSGGPALPPMGSQPDMNNPFQAAARAAAAQAAAQASAKSEAKSEAKDPAGGNTTDSVAASAAAPARPAQQEKGFPNGLGFFNQNGNTKGGDE